MTSKRFVVKNGLDNNGQTITNVANPVNTTDGASKSYVDGKVAKVASTDNALVRFNGTTGEVQDSLVVVDDVGNLNVTGSISATLGATLATTSGNVLIGTTTDDGVNKLQVYGGASFGVDTTSFQTKDIVSFSAVTNWGIRFQQHHTGSAIQYHLVQKWGNTSDLHLLTFRSGQVGIGTFEPHQCSKLDIQSTTQGVRFPNMTTAQKNAITLNASGNVVFDTTLGKLCVNTGAGWQTITSA